MNPYEQYKKNGLSKPIALKPTLKMHLLVWGGGLFLILCCFQALRDNDIKMNLIGILGMVFSGFALALFVSVLFRGRDKGLVEFSENGLWLSSIGITLPWHAIGPAWINTTSHDGGKTDETVFIVKGIDNYTSDVGLFSRIFIKLLKRTLNIGKEGGIDFGLDSLLYLLDSRESFDEIAEQMAFVRQQTGDDPSAILLNIPAPFRVGISSNELVAIINSEVLKK
ncbi:hypothetical protein [Vibrio gazogenes]|uniref:Uncharacterized protein n=1 Tax=Vibrio gazogenes TaxID=687 RepID=A0A1Z2SBU8_VIBGA|nr:hypothetical protein [Vibrio gazogenes]ASA54635.1 hypothetical protein BSQ33_02050 [Vibrio gazogenes]